MNYHRKSNTSLSGSCTIVKKFYVIPYKYFTSQMVINISIEACLFYSFILKDIGKTLRILYNYYVRLTGVCLSIARICLPNSLLVGETKCSSV